MPLSLNASQNGNVVRIGVSLDEVSDIPLIVTIDTEMEIAGAIPLRLVGTNPLFNPVPNGVIPTVDARFDADEGLYSSDFTAMFQSPIAPGSELFAYHFEVTDAGSIDIRSFGVTAQQNSGNPEILTTRDEPADLLSISFDGNASQGSTNGDDALTGMDQIDTIFGLEGDDTFIASSGNDILDGGDGADTIALNGSQDNYTLLIGTTGILITDRLDGGTASDALIDIEMLTFEGDAAATPIDLTKLGGAVNLTSEDYLALTELYIAYYNRAPDALGLNFWSTAFADGLSLEAIAADFATQAETQMTYPSDVGNNDFLLAVYDNVLGRVPDDAGLNFWLQELDSGRISRDTAILEILGGVKAEPSIDAVQAFVDQQLADRTYLETKTDLGAYYAGIHGLSNIDGAIAVMQAYAQADVQDVTQALFVADNAIDNAEIPSSMEFLMPLAGVLPGDFVDGLLNQIVLDS